jgi:hypothetical protein
MKLITWPIASTTGNGPAGADGLQTAKARDIAILGLG